MILLGLPLNGFYDSGRRRQVFPELDFVFRDEHGIFRSMKLSAEFYQIKALAFPIASLLKVFGETQIIDVRELGVAAVRILQFAEIDLVVCKKYRLQF